MKRLILLLFAAVALAAQVPVEAPLFVQLIRKPGADRQPLRQYGAARANVHVLGMVSMTGPVETWYLELHDSFGSMEDLDKALNATDRAENRKDEVLAPSRRIIAIRRLYSAYLPAEAMKLLPRAHYFQAAWSTRKPDADTRLSRPDLAYQVIDGDTTGIFLYLTPLVSLRNIDEDMARSLPGRPEFLAAATQGDNGHEHAILRVEPRLSYVSEEFAAGDPEFWKSQTQ